MAETEDNLPKIVKFEGNNSGVFNSLEHTAYHSAQYEWVKSVDQTKLKMPPTLMPTWEKNIHEEVQINEEAAKSLITVALREKDTERDRLLTNIFYVVRGQICSPVKATAEAATRLNNVLEPYTGIQKRRNEMETASIDGLETDLSTRTADVAALGLTATLAALHTANEGYKKLLMQRRGDQSDSKLPPMTKVRPKTDAAYEVVCQYIQAAYIYATADEDRAMIEGLVRHMNKTSADYKALHNQSMAQKKSSANKKPKDPKDPKPKDPKDPKDPKPKPGGGDDIHVPEEPPKKPDEEQPKPNPGGGDDIQIPSEPPKKPDGQG